MADVLATLLLLTIVLPSIMRGISLATSAAATARQRSEATLLAQAKLAELVSTEQWQSAGTAGQFGDQWPEYQWALDVQNWSTDGNVRQVQLQVTWTARGEQHAVTLSTLVYPGPDTTGTTETTGTGSDTGGGGR